MIVPVVTALAAVAVPVHVEPQVSEAPAASRFTFAFEVEHGCDGSPTVEVSIQVPPGSLDVAAVPKDGWTATVEPGDPPVVTFTGGPLPAQEPGTFAIELVTPNEPGTEVLFPTVQACEQGELAWVETEPGGDAPAPRLRLVENPDPLLPTTTTSEPTTSTTEDAATSTTTATTEQAADTDTDEEEDDDGGGTGSSIAIAVAVAVVFLGVAGSLRFRRRL